MAGNERDGNGALRIAGALTVYEVADLRGVLLRHLAAGGDLLLELDDVDRCDAAGLQLLCATRRQAERDGRSLRVRRLPPAVAEAAAAAGLCPAELAEILPDDVNGAGVPQ